MRKHQTPVQKMAAKDIRLVCKEDSRLMRAINWLLFWNDDFMTSFWTIITLPGYRRIFYPAGMSLIVAKNSTHSLWHELEHVDQADGPVSDVSFCRWISNLAFAALYLLLPIPILLAWYRMWSETNAYAVGYTSRVRGNAMKYSLDEYAQWVADALWTTYALSWPKGWTKARFLKRVAALEAA